ncbi:MAG: hypothetical protein JSR98_22005 [Proteobacteria bacterium]|nr:hypothetical protein [Pseudomonadota bacterium]
MAVSKAKLERLSAKGIVPPSMMGVWVNELGSTMTVTTVNGAVFSGSYQSSDGNGGQVTGTLNGVVSGETLAWTVSWQPAVDSTTAWSGKFLVDDNDDVYIYTLWYLSEGDQDAPVWQSFLAGQDTFWPQA